MPVDIEFAYDGTDFYLLRCRPHSYGADMVPVAIPQNLAPDKLTFFARQFVSNGKVPQLTHVVYVDLEGYSQLPDQSVSTRQKMAEPDPRPMTRVSTAARMKPGDLCIAAKHSEDLVQTENSHCD
jgi:hypothetical protein